MKTSLAAVSFNGSHLPVRAVIRAGRQRVKVEWRDVCGDWCWFIVSGYPGDAQAAIQSLLRDVERISAELLS